MFTLYVCVYAVPAVPEARRVLELLELELQVVAKLQDVHAGPLEEQQAP